MATQEVVGIFPSRLGSVGPVRPFWLAPKRTRLTFSWETGCDRAEFELGQTHVETAISLGKMLLLADCIVFGDGHPLWQGFVGSVEIRTRAGALAMSYENLATKVWVQYQDPLTSDVKFTSYESATFSVLAAERLVAFGYMNDSQAATAAQVLGGKWAQVAFEPQIAELEALPRAEPVSLTFTALGYSYWLGKRLWQSAATSQANVEDLLFEIATTLLPGFTAGLRLYGFANASNTNTASRHSRLRPASEVVAQILEVASTVVSGRLYIPKLQFMPIGRVDIFYASPNTLPTLLLNANTGQLFRIGVLAGDVLPNTAVLGTTSPWFVHPGEKVRVVHPDSIADSILTDIEISFPAGEVRYRTALSTDLSEQFIRERWR